MAPVRHDFRKPLDSDRGTMDLGGIARCQNENLELNLSFWLWIITDDCARGLNWYTGYCLLIAIQN
jgi:hypothetical protein